MKHLLMIATLVLPLSTGAEFFDYFRNYKKGWQIVTNFHNEKHMNRFFGDVQVVHYDNLIREELRQAVRDVGLSGTIPFIVIESSGRTAWVEPQGYIVITDSLIDYLKSNRYYIRLVLRHEIAHLCLLPFPNKESIHRQEYWADTFACLDSTDDFLFIMALKKMKSSRSDSLTHPGWISREKWLKEHSIRLSYRR